MNNSLCLLGDYNKLASHKAILGTTAFTITLDCGVSIDFYLKPSDVKVMLDYVQSSVEIRKPSIELSSAFSKLITIALFDVVGNNFIRVKYQHQHNNLDITFEFSDANLNEFISYLKDV